ncbi:sugar nucleotide-binding protein [bacterium]|nr:sugar nucleotide-binding protein [bacterium]
MHALITGANGTVGQALTQLLGTLGHRVTAWDRARVPIDDYFAMERFVTEAKPDVVFHLAIASKPTGRDNEGWLVNWHWPSELAWITSRADIPFVFTSTVLVYTNNVAGPITPDTQPDATEGYGGDKRRAEERVRYQNPEARIARLGWQIGEAAGSNNMIDFFETTMEREGAVTASTRWLPATSFLADTAAALLEVARLAPGTYLIDSNHSASNFYELACALNQLHGNKWKIEPNDAFTLDQRMIDSRVPVAPLSARLSSLARKGD